MKFKNTIVKFATGGTLSDRQIRAVISTPTPDRVGDIVEPSGCDLTAYRKNPIVLADHDPSEPIGTALVSIHPDRIEATITFAPAGASAKADSYCALAKAGILRTVSIGFAPTKSRPAAGGGYRFEAWALLECSLVSVPANPDALIIERAMGVKSGRVLSRSNAAEIRQASAHLERAGEHLRFVLGQADADGDDDMPGMPDMDEDDGGDRELSARPGVAKRAAARRKRVAEAARLAEVGRLSVSSEEHARDARLREAETLRLRVAP